jgi:hypothetical protein
MEPVVAASLASVAAGCAVAGLALAWRRVLRDPVVGLDSMAGSCGAVPR